MITLMSLYDEPGYVDEYGNLYEKTHTRSVCVECGRPCTHTKRAALASDDMVICGTCVQLTKHWLDS